MSADAETPSTACPNCGSSAVGAYCSGCGQVQGPLRRSLAAWLADFLDEQLSLSAALPRTLWACAVRPGQLTHEWIAGRRARWLPPVRLLVIALAALLTVSFTADLRPSSFLPDDVLREVVESFEEGRSEAGTYLPYPAPDLGTFEDGGRRTALDVAWEAQVRRVVAASLLLLVPLLALMLRLLYRKAAPYLVDHLVFSVHLVAHLLLLATLLWLALAADGTLRDEARLGEAALVLAALWLPVHVFRALTRVHGARWGPTLLVTTLVLVLMPLLGLATALAAYLATGTGAAEAQSRRAYDFVLHADALWSAGDTLAFAAFAPAALAELHRIPHGRASLHDRFHLAEIELRLGRSTAARQTAEDALRVEPDNLLLLAVAARAAEAEGKGPLAADYRERFGRAWAAFPGDPVRTLGHPGLLEAFRAEAVEGEPPQAGSSNPG